MDAKKLISITMVVLVVFSAFAIASSESSADGEKNFLLDQGNGSTEWMTASSGSTLSELIVATLNANGHSASVSGNVLTVDGKTTYSVGSTVSTGGSLSVSGTTGKHVDCTWKVYKWDSNKWVVESNLSASPSGYTAVGFYPDGVVPVENPNHKSSWTMFLGDSANSANQTADVSADAASLVYSNFPKKDVNGVYGTILYANGLAFVKYGNANSKTAEGVEYDYAYIACYDTTDGWKEKWKFKYTTNMLETTSALVVGDYLYVQAMAKGDISGCPIYRIPITAGPGTNNANVTTFNGEAWNSATTIPIKTVDVTGSAYGYGAGSLVYDSGAIYCKCNNGMIYAFNMNLELLWSYQTAGVSYFSPVTVSYGMVFAGMGDGKMYAVSQADGKYLGSYQVCYATAKAPGNVYAPSVFKEDGKYKLICTYSEGSVGATFNGIAILSFDGSEFTSVDNVNGFGYIGNSVTRYVNNGVNGVIVSSSDGLMKVLTDGQRSIVSDYFKEEHITHAAPILVNGTTLYINSYNAGQQGSVDQQSIFRYNLSDGSLGRFCTPDCQFGMTVVTVVDGLVIAGNDNGVYAVHGTLANYEPPSNHSMPLWMILLILVAAIVIVLAAMWAILRYGKGWEHPFADLKTHIMVYFFGENYTHNTKSKRKLRLVLLFGSLLTLGVALLSLCVGSDTTVGVGDAIGSLSSAIGKGGHGLNKLEMLIYNQRAPRALATIAVGIGLSVAGAVYQAVIKNPLVEPYIMGVSAGAGTMAVAVMTYGFTLFGLFSVNSPYLIAVAAIFGGLLAFALTMMLALKTGGKSINYVLSGIIIGLVFSAVQSIMMIGAGTKASSALSWLYGSFISISWETVWLIVFPCICLSFIPLVWAKELNLVLLGEDQAMQMGLDAKKFDMYMLIIVSILTAFCVAFCGIIGFVGLVIPHLARLILGGDHRLMLPVAMAFGGFLLTFSDLLSRVLITGYELPVGAITTIIGVPVFAYLLIKRGRSYDG